MLFSFVMVFIVGENIPLPRVSHTIHLPAIFTIVSVDSSITENYYDS